MTMKSTHKPIACIVAVLALVLLAGAAAALSQKTFAVAAGGSSARNLGSFDVNDILTFTWVSNEPVSAVLSGPGGFSESYLASSGGGDTVFVPQSGEYILTFTNSGSTPATVDLTYTSPGTELGNLLTIIVIIAVVIIVIIVVIVVLIFVLGSKKKKQVAMAAGAPPGIVTPTTPGMCPVCGSQTDTNAQFCAKCGARFR